MSVRTRTEAPGRVARRVQAAERVKSGAAQRAYARRRTRAEHLTAPAVLPHRSGSVMATRIPFVVAIIALLGCGLALTLLLTTRAAEDSYQLGDARSTNRRLSDERAALQREVEAADSAPELAARARELGMIPAKDPARLLVGPDGTVTVIGKPTPAQGAPAPPLNVAPVGPAAPPTNAQARGERVVPVPTSPPQQPNPGQVAGRAPNAVAVQASPLPVSPLPPVPAAASPVPPSPQEPPAPPAEGPEPAPAVAQPPQDVPAAAGAPEAPQPEAPQSEVLQSEAPQPETLQQPLVPEEGPQ